MNRPVAGGGYMPATARLYWLTGFVAASILAYEIALMRLLLIGSWHHFAFLVISIALLGFGASGAGLIACRSWIVGRGESVLFVLAVASALSIPVSQALAQQIPVESRFVPALLWQYVGLWLTFWLVLAIPFLLGAAALGGSLMLAGRHVGGVYAANLIGSAAGGIAITVLMYGVAPRWLATIAGAIGLAGAWSLIHDWRSRRFVAAVACTLLLPAFVFVQRPVVRVDPFKYGAYLDRLLEQGTISRGAARFGPRGEIRAYTGAALHNLPFVTGSVAVPALSELVVDGHWVASILDAANIDEARIMDETLMAFAYGVGRREPRVLLLGELGGMNIWLAARHSAGLIDVVQPDPNIFALLRGPMRDRGGGVLDLPSVTTISAHPRHFVDHTVGVYDLIQLALLESSAAGSGGMGGLAEDHLLTIEGLSACLKRLDDDGLVFACRGIQTPPRDNIKLLATFAAALRRNGVSSPDRHMVIVRDFLAVSILVRPRPWQADEIELVREICRAHNLTPVWFDGIGPEELNWPDALPAPPDGVGDWYYYAARKLLVPDDSIGPMPEDAAQRFIDDWAFYIRPPTDDRPFFHDFCKLRSLGALREAFGELWLTRVELAFLFTLAAAAAVFVVGFVFTIVPLPWLRNGGGCETSFGARAATAAFFACIGLAYMLTEMAALTRLTRLIGDPVVAGAVTISSFLFFSGLGSLTVQLLRVPLRNQRRVLWLVGWGLVILGLMFAVGSGEAARIAGAVPWLGLRCVIAAVLVAPMAYLMGFLMPMGLSRLHHAGAAALVPWAWGVNGFASVLAPPLAIIVAMTWGFHYVALAAVGLYGLAVILHRALPHAPNIDDS